MSKNFENKKVVVADICKKFQDAKSVVVVHFSGLTVEEDTKLRAEFRKNQVEYCVLKNKLVDIALKEMNIKGLDEHLTGPNAYAFGMEDAVSPAKVICDFIKDNKKEKENLSIKAGLMGEEILDEKQIKALAELPSREVLLARLVGSLKSSVAKLVYFMDALAKKKAEEQA